MLEFILGAGTIESKVSYIAVCCEKIRGVVGFMIRPRARFFSLLLVVAVVIAYSNSFRGVFVLDDPRAIVENPRLRHIIPQRKSEWFDLRPFVDLSFALNYATGGTNAADYHALNLIIHLCAGLALYGLVRRTLLLGGDDKWTAINSDVIALFSAALWLVHPLTTSSVTYVCQRYESMAGMLYLVSMYCVARGAKGAHGGWWYTLAVLACMLGVLSKETIVTLPFLLLLYDRVFLSSSFREAASRRKWLYVGLFSSCLLLLLPMLAGGEARGIVGTGATSSLSWLYFLTQTQVIVHYLQLSIWPLSLCLDYDWPLVSGVIDVLPSLISVFALGVVVLLSFKIRPGLGFLGVSFFLVLSVTSSFVALADPAFEHRMYLPLAPIIVLAVLAAAFACRRFLGQDRHWKECLIVMLSIAVAGLVVMTYNRNKVFYSEEEAWRDVIAKRPDNLRGYQNLGSILCHEGRNQEAMEICQEALSRLPSFRQVEHDDLITMEGTSGYRVLYKQVYNYSGVYNTIGLIFLGRDDMEEARRSFEESIRLAPGNNIARSNYASVMFKMGERDRAITNWDIVLKNLPRDIATRRAYAEALVSMGRIASAVGHYDVILSLRPDDIRSRLSLAWILATSLQSGIKANQRSLRLASDLVDEIKYPNARVMIVLAATYARAGDFEKAVFVARSTLPLVGKVKQREQINKLITLFESGRAYRTSMSLNDFWDADHID